MLGTSELPAAEVKLVGPGLMELELQQVLVQVLVQELA